MMFKITNFDEDHKVHEIGALFFFQFMYIYLGRFINI